jgi:hypothetical protein
VINPQAGALAALSYANGAGNAAIQATGTGGKGSIVMLGFPFETITTAANRAAVIDRVFDFFALTPPPPPNADFNGDGQIDAADYTVWRNSLDSSVTPGELGDADFDGQVDQQDYRIWKQQYGTSPGAGGGAGAGGAVIDSLQETTAAVRNSATSDEVRPSLPVVDIFFTSTKSLTTTKPSIAESEWPRESAFESTDLLLVTFQRSRPSSAFGPLNRPQDASELNGERPADFDGLDPLDRESIHLLRRFGCFFVLK